MDNNSPSVCVMMPVYNGAGTILMALKSLVAQRYSNWTCVIVNDGSTDGTKAILDSLTDPRFKVIHLEQNGGRGAARQKCLEFVDGDLLTYLDADDFFHPEKLSAQVEALSDDSELELVCTEVLVFNEGFNPVGKRIKPEAKKKYYVYGKPLPISMATAMIRLDKAKTFTYNHSLDASEDIDFFTRYLDGGYYCHLPLPYYYYFVSSQNTSYRKILHYTWNEFLRGVSLLHTSLISATRVMLKAAVKWGIYAISVPIVGENFFLKKRNRSLDKAEIITFRQQLEKIQKIIL